MDKLMLKAFLVLSLVTALLAGCAAPEQQGSEVEESPGPPGGVVEDGRIELSETRTTPEPASHRRPPVWLVAGGEAVQASYGLYCESDLCYAEQPGYDLLATAEGAIGEKAFLVVGGEVDGEISAGVVGWEYAPSDLAGPGVLTESGVPYYMRELDVRPVSEGEGPDVERESGKEVSVFELASTGNAGDRLLSVFLDQGDAQPTSYHLRLDPEQAGENPPPGQKDFPGEVTEVERGPGTVDLPAEEGAEVRDVEKNSLGNNPRRVEAGEGYLWVLDSREGPQGEGRIGVPGDEKAGSKAAAKKAGPPGDSILLKVDPDTREIRSTIDAPGTAVSLDLGAGAVWLTGGEEGVVLRLDPETEDVQKVGIGGNPNGIAATEDGVWVSVFDDTQSGRVVRVDPRTSEVAAEIETPGIAKSITVDGETGNVWAVSIDQTSGSIDYENNQLLRIDPATDGISGRFRVEGGVTEVVADGDAVWVANIHGGISKIDPEKGKIQSVTSLGGGPGKPGRRMEVGAGALWAVGPGAVTRLDLGSGRATSPYVELGEYEAEDLAAGEGALWVIGAGGPFESGTLTRITP